MTAKKKTRKALEEISALAEKGKVAQAERVREKAQSLLQGTAEALLADAAIAIATQRYQSAADYLKAGIQKFPDDVRFPLDLGQLLVRTGQLQKAADLFSHALSIDGTNADGYFWLAQCLIKSNDLGRAEGFLRKAVEHDPGHTKALVDLGHILILTGKASEAARFLLIAWKQKPDRGRLAHLLGEAYMQLNLNETAIVYLRHVNDPSIRERSCFCLVQSYMQSGSIWQAERELERLCKGEYEDKVMVLVWKASIAISKGDFVAAKSFLSDALKIDAGSTQAAKRLVEIDPVALPKKSLKPLMSKAKSRADLGEAIRAAFALADWAQGLGRYKEQLNWLDIGNALKLSIMENSEASFKETEKVIKESFGGYTLGDSVFSHTFCNSRITPIFICGLPRSGTTLMEQVLASHSSVSASGESSAFVDALIATAKDVEIHDVFKLYQAPFSRWIPQMREHYIASQARAGLTEGFVVDKAIQNYQRIGILRLMFPEARFISMRRHPLDLALGMYKRLFATGQSFTYSREQLCQRIADYERYIDFWRSEVGIAVCAVCYEEMVAEPGAEISRICGEIELPFEPAMLEARGDGRAVITSSNTQVRGGLKKSYLFAAEKYGELLDPFRETLSGAGVDVAGYEKVIARLREGN